jgi:copper chaperone
MLTFRIRGMTCQGCVNAVTQAVGAAAPGRPVKVTLATGEVEVGDGADVAAVAAAIERAGFEVAERPRV